MLRVPSAGATLLAGRPGGHRARQGSLASRQHILWVERDGKLAAVPVTVGLDNDVFAEIRSGDLKLGDEVVTSQVSTGKSGKPQKATTPSLRV